MSHNDTFDYSTCTFATCDIETSTFPYRPSLAGNAFFAAFFGVCIIGFIAASAVTRRAYVFAFALISGCILEVLGYAGRLMAYNNPWKQDGFLMQICCLTIAPAFMAGGIYLCLRRIVDAFGPANSRIPPAYYTRIFIPCDVISLVLQATGGGMASVASSSDNGDPTNGNNIMLAGLAFQVFTLVIFMVAASDFAYRTWSNTRRVGAAQALSAAHAAERASPLFRGFLGALVVATLGIFIRSVYRVIELAQGWEGALIKRQDLFIVLEGVMVAISVLALVIFNPAFCFKSGMQSSKPAESTFRSKESNLEAHSSQPSLQQTR